MGRPYGQLIAGDVCIIRKLFIYDILISIYIYMYLEVLNLQKHGDVHIEIHIYQMFCQSWTLSFGSNLEIFRIFFENKFP